MDKRVNAELASLMGQLSSFVTTNTVVGEPIHIDQTILVPLIDVSFGAATASTVSNKFIEKRKEREKKVEGDEGAGAGGLGAKVMPSAMIVIQNGTTQLINIRNQDSLTKLIDMIPGIIAKVPDFVAKFKGEEVVEKKETKETKVDADVYHKMSDETK